MSIFFWIVFSETRVTGFYGSTWQSRARNRKKSNLHPHWRFWFVSYSFCNWTHISGETSLFNGERRRKRELVFDVLGSVDELNSHIGLLFKPLSFYLNWVSFFLPTFLCFEKDFSLVLFLFFIRSFFWCSFSCRFLLFSFFFLNFSFYFFVFIFSRFFFLLLIFVIFISCPFSFFCSFFSYNFLSLAVQYCINEGNGLQHFLETVQCRLLDIGTHVATPLNRSSPMLIDRAKFPEEFLR